MTKARDQDVLVFPLAAQYRRSAVIALLGAILVVACAAALNWLVPIPPGRSPISAALFVALPTIALVVFTFSWRLRVDTHGIARRRFWMWDEWLWDEFESGLVSRDTHSRYQLSRRTGKPWSRSLALDLLEDDTRDVVDQLCNQVLPKRVLADYELPDELQLRLPLGQTVQLTSSTVKLATWTRREEILVVDIHSIRATVPRHDAPTVVRLELQSRERTVRIEGHAKAIVRGQSVDDAHHDLMRRFVVERMPNVDFETVAMHGPARTQAEVEYRKQELAHRASTANYIRWIGSPLLLAASVTCYGDGLVRAWQAEEAALAWLIPLTICLVLTSTMPPLLVWAVASYARIQARKEADELEVVADEGRQASTTIYASPRMNRSITCASK